MQKNERIIIYGLLVLSLLLSLYITFIPATNNKQVVSVDVKSIEKNFINQLAHQGLSEQSQRQKATNFSYQLEILLKHYASQNQLILLVKPAVIDGTPDVTKQVQKVIFTRLGVS
jgi:conjugal transfer pilin signal peptidase TrbI